MGLGASHLGGHSILCVDHNNVACTHLAANHAHVLKLDVNHRRSTADTPCGNFTATLMFGFPCQPYSSQGKRLGTLDSRARTLWGGLHIAFMLQCQALISGVCRRRAGHHPDVRRALNSFASAMNLNSARSGLAAVRNPEATLPQKGITKLKYPREALPNRHLTRPNKRGSMAKGVPAFGCPSSTAGRLGPRAKQVLDKTTRQTRIRPLKMLLFFFPIQQTLLNRNRDNPTWTHKPTPATWADMPASRDQSASRVWANSQAAPRRHWPS